MSGRIAAAAWRAESRGCGDPGRRAPYPAAVFRQLKEQGADFILTVKGQLEDAEPPDPQPVLGKAQDPFRGRDHEVSHGRNITWILRAKQAPEHPRSPAATRA
jgi:hypothetical protein